MPPRAEIHLFFLGGAGILQDGRPLGGPAAHRHRLALLALLAAHPKPVTRDKLMAWLWPERDADSGRKLLKVAVHELRKILGDQALVNTGDQLSLDPAAIPSDVAAFVDAIGLGDHERAVSEYGGPLLDGFFLQNAPEFEQWVETERARLAALQASALEYLARAATSAGDHAAAVDWWRELALHAPLRNDVALELMRALAASGAIDAAIRHADVHAHARKSELELEPDTDVAAYARQLATKPRSSPLPQPREPFATPLATSAIAPQKTRRPFTRPISRLAAVAVVVLAIATYAFTRNHDIASHDAAQANVVAVLPADVSGGDSSLAYLSQGLVDLLSSRFTGEGGPRAVDPRRIVANAPGAGVIPLNAALQRAQNLGAGQLLLAKAVALQGGLELSATLYRVSDGSIIAQAKRDVPSIDSLAQGVDRLAAELLVRSAKEPNDRVAELVQRGLPALRTYLAAQRAYAGGRYPAAETLFARTLDVDSTFGLAGLGLSLANSWNSINENYGRGRDAALKWQSTMSARDRTFLHAFFGPDPALGPAKTPAELLSAWEDVVEKYPDWAEAWYHLGDRYYHYGGLSGLADSRDRARTAFRHSLELDSSFVAPLHHLVEIYAARGEVTDVQLTADRYYKANPSLSRDATVIAWEEATAVGDSAHLARIRARLSEMPPSDLSRIVWVTETNGWPNDDAHRALAELNRRASLTSEHENASTLAFAAALNEGRHAEAFAAAAALGGVDPEHPVAAIWDMYAALYGDGGLDTALAGAAAQKLRTFADARPSGDPAQYARPLTARCLLGSWDVTRGDLASARRDIALLHRAIVEDVHVLQLRDASICEAQLTAAVAVEAKDSQASRLVANLDTVILRNRVPPRVALDAAAIVSMRLHEALGQMDQALVASRRREYYTGHPIFLSTQLLYEGRLAALTGDTAGAVRAYQHYLALRPAPDSGRSAADVAVARSSLARLTGR